MGARLRSLALVGTVVLATLGVPAATGGAVACADDGPRAGLVIDTGARVIEVCVALDAGEVTGLHLIELAAAQHGLSYGFGMGGAAVCRLDGVGPGGDDCFAEYPEFWGYWHGDGRGGWTWASTGAGSYRVGDGDMEGWVWGTGDTGASHPKPPALAFDDVCEPIAEPSPEPTQQPKPSPQPPRSTPKPAPSEKTEPAATSTPAATAPSPKPTDDERRTRTRTPSPSVPPTREPSPSADTEVMALGAPPPDGGGPPAGLFVAVALALLLGAGGWLRLRTRGKGVA